MAIVGLFNKVFLYEKGRGRVGDCRQCRRIVRVGERDLAPAGSVSRLNSARMSASGGDKSALGLRAALFRHSAMPARATRNLSVREGAGPIDDVRTGRS